MHVVGLILLPHLTTPQVSFQTPLNNDETGQTNSDPNSPWVLPISPNTNIVPPHPLVTTDLSMNHPGEGSSSISSYGGGGSSLY